VFVGSYDLSLQDLSSSIPLGSIISPVIASFVNYLSVLPLRMCMGKILMGGCLRINRHAPRPRASEKYLAAFQDL